jgi:histidinol dehydrogenase
MRQLILEELTDAELISLVRRTPDDLHEVFATTREIIDNVEANGDRALATYSKTFDGVELQDIKVTRQEIREAEDSVSDGVKQSLRKAAANIEKFHKLQLPPAVDIETVPGVRCRLEWRAIPRVGLYVPGGTAPLASTVLMLAIPARIANCSDIVLCTPPLKSGAAAPEILCAAAMCGVKNIFKVGGAQAIAAMGLGTKTVPRVDKLFGPGNRFVAAAKALLSQAPHNIAIDMLAGPSELLVIADETADPRWVAADLLSQAEHGLDSQVILVTTSAFLAEEIHQELSRQLHAAERSSISSRALENSFVVLASSLAKAVDFANLYAPEHLTLAVSDAEQLAFEVTNAGSVFIGSASSVVFGDYASGTNHTLPTSGTATATGTLTVHRFMKPMAFQTITRQGLASLTPVVASLARAEGLEAHARAAEIRGEARSGFVVPPSGGMIHGVEQSRLKAGLRNRVYMMEALIRPHLRNFQPYVSARSEAVEAKVFLDANELSFGSPVSFDGLALNRYPDPNQLELRAKLAALAGVSSDSIFIGVGSDEIIDLLVRLLCEPSADSTVILDPTYGVYRVAAELNGVEAWSVELDDNFQINVEETLRAVRPGTKLIFCCSPNNPTGNLLRRQDILALSRSFDGIVVADEAYIEFSGAASLAQDVARVSNLVVLRTLSKAWGLAGIRLGYCVANPELIEYLLKIKPPYNISSIASALALKTLEMNGAIQRTAIELIAERERLALALREMPSVRHVYPSNANFLLARFADSVRAFSSLLGRGIVVRRRNEPRLRDCLRITVGTAEENQLVLKALAEIEE